MRARPAFRSALLVLAATTLVGACGASAPGASGAGGSAGAPGATGAPANSASGSLSNPPSAAGGPMIGNRTFVSTAVTGYQLVAGTAVTLAFHGVTLSASAGCNTMGGEYHVAGTTLFVGDIAMTEMACEQDRMAQDAWLAKLLNGATVTIAETTMTLAKGDVTLNLTDRKATNLPLEGTVWTVDGVISGDAVSSVPATVAATFTVEAGKASVYTGCNWGSVPVGVADGTIGFGPLMSTARGCADEGSRQVEQAMQAVLTGTQPYLIDGDSLTIGTPGKAAIMLKGKTPMPSAAGPT